MRVSYDLDGVLAQAPSEPTKSWGRMNGAERQQRRQELLAHYECASRLYDPPEPQFWIISARRDVPDVRVVTEDWVARHFGSRSVAIILLARPRTRENVVAFKAAAIDECQIDVHYEDDPGIVRALRRVCQRAAIIELRPG